MTTPTQGLVTGALAALLIRISITGEYLRFVQPWMRWPLLATGALLLLMALKPAFGYARHEATVPKSSWLLLLPTVIVFSVAPPPLGAYVAERRAAQAPATMPAPAKIPVSHSGEPITLGVDEFTWGAAQPDDPMGLKGQEVRLEGFVSTDKAGHWYVTALVIFCCAADAVVERVEVDGQPAPPRDQWVRVTGTWVEGTGRDLADPAAVKASKVIDIPTPKNPYS
ncbi:MAG: TIGR03943 family protein [Nocardioidaceae bacterium]